ncbi:hypothetical protein Esti_000595 [Eimeria stiedai]
MLIACCWGRSSEDRVTRAGARAPWGAWLLALLVASSGGARGSEENAVLEVPGEAEVAAAGGILMEEEGLPTAADTAVATTSRYHNTGRALSHQSLSRGRRVGTLLLLASVLAVYGAARWAQAGRLASEASAAAAARSQALQGIMAQYEAQSSLKDQLSKQLAEGRAGTSQFRAEVETAAKQTEEKEKELIAELMQHAGQGVDAGALLKALSAEAETLESETEELRKKVQEFATPRAEGSMLAQAQEEQAELDVKRRELLVKKSFKVAAETRWKSKFKAGREELIVGIEKTVLELRAVEQRKLQTRAKIIENMKRALAASSDPEMKEALSQRLTALKVEVAERQAAGQRTGQFDAVEKQRQLEQLRLKVEKAREDEKALAVLFAKKQKAFLEAISPVEEEIKKLGRRPVCLGSRRKADELAVLNKRDELTCKNLVCEALEAHKRLESHRQSFAAAIQQDKMRALEEEIGNLEEEAAAPDTTEEEKALVRLRVNQLRQEISSLVPKAFADAAGAGKDMMFVLEMRDMIRYGSALHVVAALENQLGQDPGNKELESKVLRMHLVLQDARLAMMEDLEVALERLDQITFGREIYGLYHEGLDDWTLMANEQGRLVRLLASCRERRDVTARRRTRLRKQLLVYQRGDPAEVASMDVSPKVILKLKTRLVSEGTLLKFYEMRMKRLQALLKDMHQRYEDKLHEARMLWEEAAQFYPSLDARRLALGGDSSSFNADMYSPASLIALEEYQEETERDHDLYNKLSEVEDQENVSDEDLLDIPEAPELSLHEIFSTETAFAVATFQETRDPQGDEDASADVDDGSDAGRKGYDEGIEQSSGPKRFSESGVQGAGSAAEIDGQAGDQVQQTGAGDAVAAGKESDKDGKEEKQEVRLTQKSKVGSVAEQGTRGAEEDGSQQREQKGKLETPADGASSDGTQARQPSAEEVEKEGDDSQSTGGPGATDEGPQPGSVVEKTDEGEGQREEDVKGD